MVDKLNLYDMLGYLIPGGVLLLFGYLLGGLVVLGSLPGIDSVSSFSETLGGIIVLFAFSYPLGHLVQSVGEEWEDIGNRRRKARPSEQLLLRETERRRGPRRTRSDDRYSPPAQSLIKERGCSAFGLDEFEDEPHGHGTDHDRYVTRLKELFQLAWTFVIQKEFGLKADIYLAISALSRGLMVTTCVGALLAGLVVIKQLVALGWPHGVGPVHLPAFNQTQLVGGLAILIGLSFSSYVFRFHWYRFRLYFARSVWDAFVAASPVSEKKHQRRP